MIGMMKITIGTERRSCVTGISSYSQLGAVHLSSVALDKRQCIKTRRTDCVRTDDTDSTNTNNTNSHFYIVKVEIWEIMSRQSIVLWLIRGCCYFQTCFEHCKSGNYTKVLFIAFIMSCSATLSKHPFLVL